MPIDKSQSCKGIAFSRIDSSSIHSYCLWDSKTINEMEADPRFNRWEPPTLGRQDYEVDDRGHLIRLGNQIDKDLYPTGKLAWICTHHDTCSKVHTWCGRYTTIAMMEAYQDFSHWADTPMNRKLGLVQEYDGIYKNE